MKENEPYLSRQHQVAPRVAFATAALGTLCLISACASSQAASSGGGHSTTSAASSPSASPVTTSPSATASAPTTTPALSGSAGASGRVVASPANSSQIADLTAVASKDPSGACGFTTSADTLTHVKVTNNGWAIGTITARESRSQGNGQIIFDNGGTSAGFKVVSCGSDFAGDNVPQAVLSAFGSTG